MIEKTTWTYQVDLFISGPLSDARPIIRRECLREGLCVTAEPTTFIYTGGEEVGYKVSLRNYPRFPCTNQKLRDRAIDLAKKLLYDTYQHSVMIVTPEETIWLTERDQ